ncbi:MAG: hypothetical protein ACERLM_01800 [Acidimicrobiales bacterium]
MPFRLVLILLVAATLVACSDEPAASPDSTTLGPSTTVAVEEVAPTSAPMPAGTVPPSSTPPGSTTPTDELPERCVARTDPMYPNAATERWVPSPETGDVIDDFALLVLGWPDVQVGEEQPEGPVTLVRITSSASPQPVELVVVPDRDGQAVSVCSARSVIGDDWAASVLIEGRQAHSGFGIWVDLDDSIATAVHELFPDVVSAQLLISHGPHVQQVAATDPEQGWTFELDHPTTEPGWQLAFWRDADGAALAVVDTPLPAGDVAAG